MGEGKPRSVSTQSTETKKKKNLRVAYPTINGSRDTEPDKDCNDGEEGREATAGIQLRENEQ